MSDLDYAALASGHAVVDGLGNVRFDGELHGTNWTGSEAFRGAMIVNLWRGGDA
jgi:hypothetical protein